MSRALLALAAIVAACGGQPMAPYSPAEKRTELSAQKLYSAAEGALLDQGNSIAKADPQNFRLETKKRALLGSEISKHKYEYVWIVETAGGTIRIRLECRSGTASGGEDCGDERPEKLVKQQARLLDQILTEAGGDQSD
jgi:hypothetical protein